MSNRLISSIYLQGDMSSAHNKGGGRSRDWSFVPKNAKHKGKGKRVNVWLHAYEMQHGTGSTVSDPLLEMLK